MVKDKKNKSENLNSESGVSLIITFFVMIIILSVVLSVSILLYSEVKVIRDIGNSTVGFYAADSGIEKVLYYDRQAVPVGSKRGLCSMLTALSYVKPATDSSIYYIMGSESFASGTTDSNNGCDPAFCDDCSVTFSTNLDTNITYSTTATITPSSVPSYSDFKIDSKGFFGGEGRQIQIDTTTAPTP